MNTIYKYESSFIESERFTNFHWFELELPMSARIVKTRFVYTVGSILSIWAIVDTEIKIKEKRRFEVFGTGYDIKNIEELNYIDTFFDERYVWHIFERIQKRFFSARIS